MVLNMHLRRIARAALLASLVANGFACAGKAGPPPKTATAPEVVLHSDSADAPLDELVHRGRLTVLLFFSAECPVQKAHDARTRELASLYEAKGVTFAAVVSEAGANLAGERDDARRRGLTMPVLEDRGATLADALGVEYSTHVVLLDRDRRVLYSGAVDADRTHLTDTSERYLRDAIEATLSGGPVKQPRVEALGCPLRKH
jgi:hypothetical protein